MNTEPVTNCTPRARLLSIMRLATLALEYTGPVATGPIAYRALPRGSIASASSTCGSRTSWSTLRTTNGSTPSPVCWGH